MIFTISDVNYLPMIIIFSSSIFVLKINYIFNFAGQIYWIS